MFETLKNAFKVKEIRKKIFITLLILLVYRIGCRPIHLDSCLIPIRISLITF